jgi:monothiol glutaredoxin
MTDYKQVIQEQIKSKPVFVYMKGTPNMPMCGFSARVVAVMNEVKADFGAVNILDDAQQWEALKQFTNWPTSPQIFVKGEFVGGCDIVCELFDTGELQKMLA